MNATRKLRQTQQAFAAHIRDPEHHPRPEDVEDRRMSIYRELFYKNIESFLANNFPVIRKLSGDDYWHALARDFFVKHRAHTPLFPELPREFLRYLQDVRGLRDEDPPFLLELAHYEWVELALSLDTHELDDVTADANGDLLQGKPVLSPLAWPLSYRYPVHQIRPEYRPGAPPADATYLLAYRNREDQVRFMVLNPVSARLLALLKEEPGLTGHKYLERIATELQHPDPKQVIEAGRTVLEEFKQRDVILGIGR